jgi:hypothetical protein
MTWLDCVFLLSMREYMGHMMEQVSEDWRIKVRCSRSRSEGCTVTLGIRESICRLECEPEGSRAIGVGSEEFGGLEGLASTYKLRPWY